MDVKEYQLELSLKLARIFSPQEIVKEWPADVGKYNLYSPRLDIAIGPFAISQHLDKEYDVLQTKFESFINGLIDIHNFNLESTYIDYHIRTLDSASSTNYNPRCFFAIEIENNVSRKHLIGGAINASALGRFGLFIAFNAEKFTAMKKLEGYFKFLTEVKKKEINTNNLFILFKEQFSEYLDNYIIIHDVLNNTA